MKENNHLIEEIKDLSKVKEVDVVDVKAIYDRLKLFSKDEWSKIIDLGTQTKIFNNLELANLRTVLNDIKNNETPKEQSLEKVFESINKLKKFGISI